MKQKEDLFRLIQSMSRSEKRYFTIEAKKWGTNETRYLELYNLINGMKVYDEEKLRKRFPRNLSADKNYLYEALLKNIRDFNRNGSCFARIRELIFDAKNLYKRGLYTQVENRLAEAKSLAVEVGDHLALLEINQLEPFISWHTNKDFIAHIKTLFKERKQIGKKLQDELEYTELSYLLSMAFKKGMDPASMPELEGPLSELKKLAGQPEKLDEVSDHGQRRLFQCLAIQAQMSGDHDTAAVFFEKVVDWWKGFQKYKTEEFSRYLVDISNLINAYYTIEAYDSVWAQIKRLEGEANDDTEVKGLVFLKATLFKILFFMNTGSVQNLAELGDSIADGLNQYHLNEGSRITLISNMAVYCFCCEDFQNCIEWCEKVIKQRNKSETRIKDQIGLQLLWLMSKIELDDVDEIENALRSTRRFLKQRKVLVEGNFEYLLFDLLKKLVPTFGRERTNHLECIRSRLQAADGQYQSIPLDLQELGEYWAESRISGKPIIEVIKEKT
jgi:hypothetical protein